MVWEWPLAHQLLPTLTNNNLLPDETMATTMEVDVDELWTRTVANKPITTPATGFERTDFSVKTSPACFPPRRRNAELRKLNEQTNKYNRPKRNAIFIKAPKTRRTFPVVVSSIYVRKNLVSSIHCFEVHTQKSHNAACSKSIKQPPTSWNRFCLHCLYLFVNKLEQIILTSLTGLSTCYKAIC